MQGAYFGRDANSHFGSMAEVAHRAPALAHLPMSLLVGMYSVFCFGDFGRIFVVLRILSGQNSMFLKILLEFIGKDYKSCLFDLELLEIITMFLTFHIVVPT